MKLTSNVDVVSSIDGAQRARCHSAIVAFPPIVGVVMGPVIPAFVITALMNGVSSPIDVAAAAKDSLEVMSHKTV